MVNESTTIRVKLRTEYAVTQATVSKVSKKFIPTGKRGWNNWIRWWNCHLLQNKSRVCLQTFEINQSSLATLQMCDGVYYNA